MYFSCTFHNFHNCCPPLQKIKTLWGEVLRLVFCHVLKFLFCHHHFFFFFNWNVSSVHGWETGGYHSVVLCWRRRPCQYWLIWKLLKSKNLDLKVLLVNDIAPGLLYDLGLRLLKAEVQNLCNTTTHFCSHWIWEFSHLQNIVDIQEKENFAA